MNTSLDSTFTKPPINGMTGEAEFEHLAPSVQQAATLGAHARIEIIRGDWIVRHAAVEEGLNAARWLMEGPRRTRTMGLLITGEVGAGKTTLAKLIERIYPVVEGANEVPVVMISLTGARHMRTVYGRILAALNGPVKSSHHTSDREDVTLRLLRAVRCRGLIVDEVQDVLAGSRNEQRRTLDGLKFIMNAAKLPVIATGTPAATEAFRTDQHMEKRFYPISLPTWSVGVELASLLAGVSRIIPLRRPSDLTNAGIMEFVVKKGGGCLHDMMMLVRSAAIRAILSGNECITLDDLRCARSFPEMKEIDRVRIDS